jgi:hypothetical protein
MGQGMGQGSGPPSGPAAHLSQSTSDVQLIVAARHRLSQGDDGAGDLGAARQRGAGGRSND